MSDKAEATGTQEAVEVHHDEHEEHHAHSFWRTYVFSTDHKVIGMQYGFCGLAFLFFGYCLIATMRWSMAYDGQAIPFVGPLLEALLGNNVAPGGVMSAELYNVFGAMHGTIMVFMGIVPAAFAAFGNYVVPLQIGAVDMAFPRVNMASFWAFFFGCVIMSVSFFIPGGAAQAGWTSYSPLATVIPTDGQTYWLIGMVMLITSSLLGAVNFLATIINMRAPGMTWLRLPFFVWAQFITAFLLLLAFPPLEAAGILQLMDRVLETSFFLPTGLVVGGQDVDVSGGGSPLLWQHLFWFLAHPEVYVLILPGMGIVAEIIANNTRKPIWGYKFLVGSVVVLGFLAFIVWAHHMYMTGMGTVISAFFQTTTLLISIPSVIILTCLLISLWGGSIRFNTPMLFALAFLPMFGIGGLTGLPLGFNFSDVALHDSYYVIAHFHYVVAPGTIFAIFAGVYYWFPKMTGRKMSEFWGRVHFWSSLIFMNLIFMPMFAQGMAGMSRRMSDGGATYSLANPDNADVTVGALSDTIMGLNVSISAAAWAMLVAQVPFIINLFWSVKHGEKVESDNPWQATTLEWETPTPPPHGNFIKEIKVYRDPYEYSVPGARKDFSPQAQPAK
ncbi:MAG: cytochrome C oxidase subunit I [Verrucomicrobiales bacterium]|jgi:cytochrome c oxidase subunit 1|nr:cytochrome C oxidase subunit I [Verrucomicrobiales bacterium]MDP6678005.1 cbb3-type cytochrome c oxidase subunit I [Verrucomicrobiota bacterium]MDP6753116.1 cbb3-type cytochrome c oxidase subunit I [Verrucomicrobiota bacterium]MDP7012757.1 cbb3-type cytochrome c oxidase subunit I [Verrucomicrobiota bacterium]